MTKNRWILVAIAAVIVVGAGVWFARRGGGDPPAVIDLVNLFPTAVKAPATAGPETFGVKEQRIAGETRRAIYANPQSRITWKVTLPNDAWLRTSLAVDEQAWDKDGDGVLFLIALVDNNKYVPLLTQHVDPHAVPSDRRWVPVSIDLSPYSGHTVDIVFNTRNSLPGHPDDKRNDIAYWGTPAVTLRP